MWTLGNWIVLILGISTVAVPASSAEIPSPSENQDSSPVNLSDPEPTEKTVIQSDRLDVINTDEGNRFIFFGSVHIEGQDFTATCDRIEVRTDAGGADDFGAIAYIEATGNVVILQEGRKATAGKALIYPQEDKVVLEDGPVVSDERGKVSGYRMVLQGENRKITIERGPDGEQPRVELPSLESIKSESEND